MKNSELFNDFNLTPKLIEEIIDLENYPAMYDFFIRHIELCLNNNYYIMERNHSGSNDCSIFSFNSPLTAYSVTLDYVEAAFFSNMTAVFIMPKIKEDFITDVINSSHFWETSFRTYNSNYEHKFLNAIKIKKKAGYSIKYKELGKIPGNYIPHHEYFSKMIDEDINQILLVNNEGKDAVVQAWHNLPTPSENAKGYILYLLARAFQLKNNMKESPWPERINPMKKIINDLDKELQTLDNTLVRINPAQEILRKIKTS